MKVGVRKESAGTLLSHEYFYFEKEIFGGRYKSCPNTYKQYKRYFLYDYLVVEIRIDDELAGLLIADIVLTMEVYYIRLIAIEKEFRGKNLSQLLLQELLKHIEQGAYLIFVSENTVIESTIRKISHYSSVHYLSEPIRRAIKKYNGKLQCIRAHEVVKEYYHVRPEGSADAILFVLRENDAR